MQRSFLVLLVSIALFFGNACSSVADRPGTGGSGGRADGAGGGGRAGGAGGGSAGAHGSGGGGDDAGGGSAGGKGPGGGGQGGQAADGGQTCDELVTDYANAIPAARACSPGATNQCQQIAASVLTSCPACPLYVNDVTVLSAIQAQWVNQGCRVGGILCPQIICIPAPSACASTSTTAEGPNAGASPGGVCSGTTS